MANLIAYENVPQDERSGPHIRYEWRPNIKEQDEGYDGPPEYLDTGQLLKTEWDIILNGWNMYSHVAYCTIDASDLVIAEDNPHFEFVAADS